MRYVSALTALMLLSSATAMAADVYRSVDAQGRITYSDTPTPGAQLVNVRTARDSAATPTAEASRIAAQNAAAAQQLAQTKAADAKQAVQADVAQTRADQCKKAQDAYQKVIAARRIYSTDANGERQYLSDADADQMRVTARQQMDDACQGIAVTADSQ